VFSRSAYNLGVRIRKKTKWWIAAGAVVLYLALLPPGLLPGFQGRLQAHVDLAFGHYQLLAYGLSSGERDEYARLLHERYGIEFTEVAGCTVSESLVEYADAYDSVSEEAAKRRFGPDIFKKTGEEAEKNRDQQVARSISAVLLVDGTKLTGNVTATSRTEITVTGDDKTSRTFTWAQVKSVEYRDDAAKQ
jgi:hypothetical protein